MADNSENDERIRAPKPDFSSELMENLFYWARDRVVAEVTGFVKPSISRLKTLSDASVLGAFVSFKKRGRLRSCMGYMCDGVALSTALESAAVSAATRDPRFPPIDSSEFYDLDLEVWILGSLREIETKGDTRRDSIKIGRNGVQIQGRGRRGLLLPSVALEMNWGVERFLDGVCDKAGLARGAWKDEDVRLWTFEGVSFKKPLVWNVSRNPELGDLIAKQRKEVEINDNPSSQRFTKRPTFSLSPRLFHWQFPKLNSEHKQDMNYSDLVRPAAVAGMFYPRSGSEQTALLDRFDAENFSDVSKGTTKVSAVAALVPHAGWIYSGRLAAKTLSKIEAPETVIVVAPKHRREGSNFAVMPYGKWDYNGGYVENDLEVVDNLVDVLPNLQKDVFAHQAEHSIEVQLPLIARYFPKAKVVGLLICSLSKGELTEIATTFAKFLIDLKERGKKALVLISSDMNHYATDAATRVIDQKALDALDAKDPDCLFDVVVRNGITMCGILPAYMVLLTLKKNGFLRKAVKIGYATSGDASGDLERVVGYAGYIFE